MSGLFAIFAGMHDREDPAGNGAPSQRSEQHRSYSSAAVFSVSDIVPFAQAV